MERKFIGWVSLILLVILANAGLSYRALNVLLENEARGKHTRLVLLELEETLSTLRDAETGQRGYLLTGKENYLEPYNSAVSRADEELRTLRELTADNASQQQILSLLERKVAAKLDELKQTVELRRQGRIEAAQQVVASERGYGVDE